MITLFLGGPGTELGSSETRFSSRFMDLEILLGKSISWLLSSFHP